METGQWGREQRPSPTETNSKGKARKAKKKGAVATTEKEQMVAQGEKVTQLGGLVQLTKQRKQWTGAWSRQMVEASLLGVRRLKLGHCRPLLESGWEQQWRRSDR
jgi:hypothetical protein